MKKLMKSLKYFFITSLITLTACSNDGKNDILEESSTSQISSKEGIVNITEGIVRKKDNMYNFHFKDNKGASIDLQVPINNKGTFTANNNSEMGTFTNTLGKTKSLFSYAITLENTSESKTSKSKGVTGTLSLKFYGDSEPIEINFYNLVVGYLSEIQFLFLPTTLIKTFSLPNNGPEVTEKETFSYDSRARIDGYKNELNFPGTLIVREEQLNWGENGKIESIKETRIFERGDIRQEGESISEITFDGNGSVEKIVKRSLSAPFEGFITEESDLIHNANTGALEFQENRSFNPSDGSVSEINTSAYVNDADNNHLSVERFFAFSADTPLQPDTNATFTYEERKNYAADLGKTTPNRNLISTPEEYFGPKNRIGSVSTFKNENDDVFNNVEDIEFTYNFLGFPVRADIARFQRDQDGQESPTTIEVKTYQYQLAIIFR